MGTCTAILQVTEGIEIAHIQAFFAPDSRYHRSRPEPVAATRRQRCRKLKRDRAAEPRSDPKDSRTIQALVLTQLNSYATNSTCHQAPDCCEFRLE